MESDEVLISVDRVSKKYCKSLKRSLIYGLSGIYSDVTGINSSGSSLLRKSEFWSIREVSFEVRRGECVGLIGPNGAGKTTLLKMINGLIRPDEGSITVRGRVGALISLGAGFNPVLTGRENVFINGSVLGFSQREINKKYDSIVEFAGVGEFIDSPVYTYSSGMVVRLGFAIASSLDSDVLLIDEILAVGDLGFKSRCFNRIAEVSKKSALVFVSHSMAQIAKLSTQAILLSEGKISYHGRPSQAIHQYYELFETQDIRQRGGTGEIRLGIERLNDQKCGTELKIRYGEKFALKISAEAVRDYDEVVIDIGFWLVDELVSECNNYVPQIPIALPKGKSIIKLEIDCLQLNPGRYRLNMLAMDKNMTDVYDWVNRAAAIQVVGEHLSIAGSQMLASWSIHKCEVV